MIELTRFETFVAFSGFGLMVGFMWFWVGYSRCEIKYDKKTNV